jgi:hypothetical protein
VRELRLQAAAVKLRELFSNNLFQHTVMT